LELTESLLIEDAETAQQTLEALSQLGVRLALDDFGTGYSSLGYLHRFNVGAMKIDRSFVQQIELDARSRAVVQAITTTAHALEMDVTAEGLETPAQVETARALGCDRGQGYFFAPALPAEAVERLLHAGYRAPLELGAAADD
jgi:EAL domain-containing protein (putative c-di-GMP-specific phosphodiesterase class I)